MVWIKAKMNGDPLHSERVSQHRQAVAPVHRLEATPKVALGRRSQLRSTRHKLVWLMLGLVSCALIAFVVARWSGFNELVDGTDIKRMVSSLTKHRQSGGLPAQSLTTEESKGDLKHSLKLRMESLPPTAAGMEDDTAFAAEDKDSSRNTTSSEHHPEEDDISATTERRLNETISDTGTTMSTMPISDDMVIRLQKLAESGVVKAQNILGAMYATGDGVQKDTAKAVEWFEKAAAQGDADAQTILAMMYRRGEAVPKSAATPSAASSVAVNPGSQSTNRQALQSRATSGTVRPGTSDQKATSALTREVQAWLKRLGYNPGPVDGIYGGKTKAAIEQFQRDIGVTPDGRVTRELKMHLKQEFTRRRSSLDSKAAAQGDADAQFRLGVMYRVGEGVPKNPAGAIEWFKKAAAQGNSDAQFNLGMMHYSAEGTSTD